MSKYIFCFLLVIVIVTDGLYNAARFKPAMQSTTPDTVYAAYKGVDGNYDGNAFNEHCQHTSLELIPWWMVDLSGQFVVEQIQLTNRQDIYLGMVVARRLRNFDIEIFQRDPRLLSNFPNITGQVCYHQSEPLDPGTFNFACPVPITGRFVRLVMRPEAAEYLHICEMEVLVSGSSFEEIYFKRQEDTAMGGTPLDTVNSSDFSSCLQECLHRRSIDYCTALNWVSSTRSCQLFSINPFIDLNTNLRSAPGTYFYSQRNGKQEIKDKMPF